MLQVYTESSGFDEAYIYPGVHAIDLIKNSDRLTLGLTRGLLAPLDYGTTICLCNDPGGWRCGKWVTGARG
jgi:hypothetical protein